MSGNLHDLMRTLRLAAPLALGSTAFAVYELADRIFLGRFSPSALAAVLPGGMLACILTAVLCATFGYSGTFVARFFGAGDRPRTLAALAQGLWLTLAALPLFLLAAPGGLLLLSVTGHAPDVLAAERTYFLLSLVSGAITVLTTVLGGYFAGLGRTRIVGLATLAGCLANILLDPLLIFAAKLGIAGAGLASVAAAGVNAAILVCALRAERPSRRDFRFNRALACGILRQGLPFGLSAVVGAGSFTLFTLALGCVDATALAVGNACFALHGILYQVTGALENAVHIEVGQTVGASDTPLVRRATHAGVLLALGATAAFYLALLPFAETILGLFATGPADDGFLRLGKTFLLILAVRDVFEGLQRVYTGTLRGTGDTGFILLAHVIGSVVVWMPLVLAAAAGGSATLVWVSSPLALGFHALLLRRRLVRAPTGRTRPASRPSTRRAGAAR